MFERTTSKQAALTGGIAQLMDIPLGGAKQWILLRGESRENPLLLYLHGGPGMSLIGVSAEYFRELEKDFIVVNWDQRGSGLSADAAIPSHEEAVEQYVSDAIALTEHLLKRFKREKLFLVGHSWGSAIGALVVERAPHLYYGFIGAGQVAYMAKNEEIEYQKLKEHAEAKNLTTLSRQLEEIGRPPYENVDQSIRLRAGYTLTHRYNNRSEFKMRFNFVKAAMKSTEYNLIDLIRYGKGHANSVRNLWGPLLEINLFERACRFQIPVFFILGRYDNVVLPELSEEYINMVEAPHKELIWFQTGHSMQYETPALFQQTVREKFLPLLAPPNHRGK